MSNNNDNWINAIKQKADQASRKVPEGSWEAIAKSLPHQAPVRRNRAFFTPSMWKGVAAAAAVAIAVTTGLFILDNEQQPQKLATTIPSKPIENGVSKPANSDSSTVSTVTPTFTPQLAQNTTVKPAKAHHSLHSTTKVSPTHFSTNTHHAKKQTVNNEREPADNYPYFDEEQLAYEFNSNELNVNEFNPDEYFYDLETMQALGELYAEYDNVMNQEAMEPWKAFSDSTYQQHLVFDANARKAAREKMALTKHHKKTNMLLAAYGNGLISSDRNNSESGSSAAMMAPAVTHNPNMMMAPGVTPKVAPPVNYSYHHHMPITVGVTASKRILGNLYGNVGLNFTSMSSDVTPDNGSHEFKQNIKLVGLPFGIKWNFWRYRGLSTFIGGEGLVERVVSAKFNNECWTIKRLQWSVHAIAGAQYNFNRHIGIYIEPKLSHYITTLPLNTLRNEHPLNFNLQLGISFDF